MRTYFNYEQMKYLGGKSRIGKKIALILDDILKSGKEYYEPCVGSAWVTSYLQSPNPKICSDSHLDLILLWQALQNGWVPPENINEAEYIAAKALEPSALRGFIGFGCSWGGNWWGGYARGEGRNWTAEASRSLIKKRKRLKNTKFIHCSLYEICPSNSIIYYDPPYYSMTEYNDKFDHNAFWDHVRLMRSKDNIVIISEYSAPSDFSCIAEFPFKTGFSGNGAVKEDRIERLFTLK